MIGIIGAMEEEVAALKSEMADAKVTEFASMTFYKGTLCGKEAVVVRSGIGKVNAAFKAFEVIQKTGCKTLLNLGTAGSSYFDAHALVEVMTFVQRDMDVSPLGFQVGVTPMDHDYPAEIALDVHFGDLAQGICGTGDSFETGLPKVPCNLVDMEGYALAKVCKKVRCTLNFGQIYYRWCK